MRAGTGFRFHLAGFGTLARASASLFDILRDALAAAMDAFNTVRLTHLFQKIIAGFRGCELFGYVYEVHLRSLM